MARIGNIPLGGYEILGRGEKPIVSAVAFELSIPSSLDYIYLPPGGRWEIELKAGQASIVARSPDELGRSALLGHGLEQVQRSLDLISFEQHHHNLLKEPGDRHVLLFRRDDQLVLQHFDVSNLDMKLTAQLTVKDKDGNIISPDLPPPIWTPGLRFYRMSQASKDLYEAYRDLFLGFESLLSAVCPQQPAERERKWLLRAMKTVETKVNLKQFVPANCTDPSAYIVGTQYDHIRCRLFHAKPLDANVPLNIPDPEEVAFAYEQLLRIWRQIAQGCLLVRGGGNGTMTYVGFKRMMDNELSQNLGMYLDDTSPFGKEDTQVSPLGKQVVAFESVQYLGETAPGRVSFLGSHSINQLNFLSEVHRICSTIQNDLVIVSHIEAGLHLTSVDYFESLQTVRLVNKDLPRGVFGSYPD